MRPLRSSRTWRRCVPGEVYRPRAPRGARGHEQAGVRCTVVVQSHLLPLSTGLIAPTPTSARAATFGPEVSIDPGAGRADECWGRAALGESAGHLGFEELRQVDAALRLVPGL
jgi:mRNA interferase MazF